MERPARTYPAAFIDAMAVGEDGIIDLAKWLLGLPGKAPLACIVPTAGQTGDSAAMRALAASGFQVLSYGQMLNQRVPQGARYLAAWPDVATLDRIESRYPSAVAVAPWVLDHAEIWRAARSPVEIYGALARPGPTLEPLVEAALETLISLSNASNGLASYNRDYAVVIFRKLRKQTGLTWDPAQVGAYAAAHGWDIGDAAALGVLSEQRRPAKDCRVQQV